MATQLVRRIAVVVLLAAFILPAGSWHATRADDDVCIAAEALHDAANHRIDNAGLPGADGAEHCAICHWWQSLRLTQSSVRSASHVNAAPAHTAPAQSFVSQVQTSTLHGRAPPALV